MSDIRDFLRATDEGTIEAARAWLGDGHDAVKTLMARIEEFTKGLKTDLPSLLAASRGMAHHLCDPVVGEQLFRFYLFMAMTLNRADAAKDEALLQSTAAAMTFMLLGLAAARDATEITAK